MTFDMLFKEKKNAFLKNTVNKHSVINVTLTELIQPWCNASQSYHDTAIPSRQLHVQSQQ